MQRVAYNNLNLTLETHGARQSNIELLRILSMVFIVAAHWIHAFAGINVSGFPLFNLCFYHVFRGFGQIGVNSFLLISGYFLSKSKFKIQSFLRIAFQVVFYACVLLIANAIIHPDNKWSVGGVLAYILLLSNGDFWFVGPYIAMFLLSPFINVCTRNLRKEQFVILLFIVGMFVSVLPTVFDKQIWPNELTINIIHFVFIYLIGAYISRFVSDLHSRAFAPVVCLGFFLIFLTTLILPNVLGVRKELVMYFQARSNVMMVACSVLLFLVFKQIRMKPSKLVNLVGGSTFGIYLLHENFMTRHLLWRDFFHVEALSHSNLFALYAIETVFIVFAIGFMVDVARKYLLEKPLFALLDKKLGNVFKNVNGLFVFEDMSTKKNNIEIRYLWLHFIVLTMATIMSVLIPIENIAVFLAIVGAYIIIWLVV